MSPAWLAFSTSALLESRIWRIEVRGFLEMFPVQVFLRELLAGILRLRAYCGRYRVMSDVDWFYDGELVLDI